MSRTLPFAPAFLILCSAVLCGLSSAAHGDDTITGKVQLAADSITGVSSDPNDTYPAKANTAKGRETVNVNYVIVFTTQPNGTKTLDTTKSYVTFTDTAFTTSKTYESDRIPITHVSTDPKDASKITSIDIKGNDWYSPKWIGTEGKGKNDIYDEKISGHIDFNSPSGTRGTGTIVTSYSPDKSGKPVYTYTTTNAPASPGPPKAGKGATAPVESQSTVDPSKSIDFNASTGILSISHDSIVKTSAFADPLVGSNVSLPEFQFNGVTSDGKTAVFTSIDDTSFTVSNSTSIFQQSTLLQLQYDFNTGDFYGSLLGTRLSGVSADSPLYDPGLTGGFSPFQSALDGFFNPSSGDYDPEAGLFVTITPDVNFQALTNDFQISGGTGATDFEFAANAVPEPSTIVGFGFTMFGLLVYESFRWRKHHRVSVSS